MKRLIPILLSLALGYSAAAAISQSEREVQTLANFPALQKLATGNDGATRAFLSRVSASYRKAGYTDFARELRQSTPLVVLFGQPERADAPGALKRARAALRDLESALTKNRFVVLPTRAGDTIPDYYGIASAFVESSGIALKNVIGDKNVLNSLRNNKGTRWLTNGTGGKLTFNGTGLHAGAFVLVTHAGTETAYAPLTLAGNAYAGTTTLNSGAVFVSGSAINVAANGDTRKAVAFPPGLDLPLDQDYTITRILALPETIDGVDFAAGTQIISISEDYVIPSGAFEVSGSFTLYFGVPNASARGTGNLTISPNSLFGGYRLTGAVTTLLAPTSGRWLAFPPGVAVLGGSYIVISTSASAAAHPSILLGRDYATGAIPLVTGTRIAFFANEESDPAGTIPLPAGDVVLTPVPVP